MAGGRGGILSLRPCHEAGDLEEIWEARKYLDAAIQVRERLMSGDLRALYLLWLCAADDDYNDPAEMMEPPVPHGISGIATHGSAVLSYFGLDPLLLVAAGQDVEAAPTDVSTDQTFARWVKALSNQRAKDLLLQLLIGDTVNVKAGVLGEIRDARPADIWPTTDKQRSLAQLLRQSATLRSAEHAKQARKAQAQAKREATKAERQHAKRMKEMVKDPNKWLRDAEQLVDARGVHNYKVAAEILYDLREAVGGKEGDKITRRHAAHLAKKSTRRSII